MVNSFFSTTNGFMVFNGTYRINMIPVNIKNETVIPNNPKSTYPSFCKIQAFKVVEEPFIPNKFKEVELELSNVTKYKTFSELKLMLEFINEILSGKYDPKI